jgi:hypothetical protein
VQLFAADAERVLAALVGPGAVAVEGDAVGVDAEFGHDDSFRSIVPSTRSRRW